MGLGGTLFEYVRGMGLELDLLRFVAIISEYFLIPFSPSRHDPSIVILATLAYPLGISLLLTSTASSIGGALLRAILEIFEKACLLLLIILASPAWILSLLVSRPARQRVFAGRSFDAKQEGPRPVREEESWGRTPDIASELYPAFDILGVRPDASPSEIRSAYRNLMKVHHPDKFMTSSPAEQERAQKRTVEIRAAYEDALSSHPYIH
jgi:hypothetical protein